MEIAGAGGRTLAEEWAEVPRAYLGLSVPGFPNMFLLYGPNTNGGTGSVIYTIEGGDRPRDRRARRARAGGRARGSRSDARRPRPSTASCAPRSPGRSGTRGCTNWYVDENGNDPSQWPWMWSTYRRRAARIEPGDYQVGAPAPARAHLLVRRLVPRALVDLAVELHAERLLDLLGEVAEEPAVRASSATPRRSAGGKPRSASAAPPTPAPLIGSAARLLAVRVGDDAQQPQVRARACPSRSAIS